MDGVMTKGWHFTDGIQHYYVGAATADAARKLLEHKYPQSAKLSPEEIPASLVRFFPLEDGKIATARLFQG